MKYAIMIFTLLVSLSAFTSNSSKQEQQQSNTTAKNPPTAKPKAGEPTMLDDLVRGELAAMQAYDAAMKEVKDSKVRDKLKSIRNEHEKAASRLSKYVAAKPELLEDTKEAGAWGEFSEGWTKTRSVAGKEGALKALHDGEEHGLNEYQDALEDESLSADLKKTIKEEMIPKQKKHMKTLKEII